MVRTADVRPCPNCASKVVPVSVCNACGTTAVHADAPEVDRKIVCTECQAENPTLFVCEKCSNRFLFEEVAGPHKEQFACLLCGTFVDADAKSCPACGAVFEEEAPGAPAARKERPKRKVRGEYTDADVDEIARIPGVGRAKAEALCRAGYNALWRIKRASDEELGRVRLIGPRGAKMVKDSLKFILLLPKRKSKEEVLSEEYACPLCGCVTSLFAKGCSDCGALFDEEELDDELRREVAKELDKGLLAFYEVHLEEEVEAASDALAALTSLTERECPICGQQVLPDARVCPACGHRLEPETAPRAPVEELDVEAPPEPPRPEPAVPEFVAMKELEEIYRQAPSVRAPAPKASKEPAPVPRPSPPPRPLPEHTPVREEAEVEEETPEP